MSGIAVSSYFLWTQKGQTVLPLVRGSGFVLRFRQLQTFYHYHIMTAAHVACPARYKQLYGNSIGFKAIGVRHISTRLLTAEPETHTVAHSLDLCFQQHLLPSVDVVSLRCKDEEALQRAAVVPLELDPTPVEANTRLLFCGVEAAEERANPTDDRLRLHPRRLSGVCKAALVSMNYGTVFLASLDDAAPGIGDTNMQLLLSMCGGPVLRESTGLCVGVIVARVVAHPPTPDPETASLYRDPCLDISGDSALQAHGALHVAFAPVSEFEQAMRLSET